MNRSRQHFPASVRLTGVLIGAALIMLGCTNDSGSDESSPELPAMSEDDFETAFLTLIDEEVSPEQRAELIEGSEPREDAFGEIDVITSQADSEIVVEVHRMDEVGDSGIYEADLFVKLAAVEGVRGEVPIGSFLIVGCKCDGERVTISDLSFCFAVETIGGSCE